MIKVNDTKIDIETKTNKKGERKMSTRSNIIIKNGKTNILLYRHCDGYLTGAGQDLHDDLKSSYFVSYSGVDLKNYNSLTKRKPYA